jgi:hypothetical protein
MSVVIEKREFLNLSLGESVPTSYPSDNQGDVVQAQIYVRVEDYVIATGVNVALEPEAILLVIKPNAELIDLLPEDDHLYTNKVGGFEDFKVGMQITILNTDPVVTDTGLITAFAAGSNTTVTSNGHGRSNGDQVTIFGTTSYNGTFTISNVTALTFDISAPFVADDATGTWNFSAGESAFTITRNVQEVVTGQLIRVDVPFTQTEQLILNDESVVYFSTPIQSIEFERGLIENDEGVNYLSKLTGTTRRARVEGLSNTVLTPKDMDQLGDNSAKYGTLSVRGNGTGLSTTNIDVAQAFIITETYVVGPLSTSGQVNNIKSRIAPPWLIDSKSLRYVFKIELSEDLNNPNDVKIGISDNDLKGFCGFTDENLNTGIKRYSVSDVVYTRPDLSNTPAIELSENEITVSYFLNNTFNTPFSDGDTRLVFNHWVLHTDPDQYRLPQFPDPENTYPARDRFMKENQLFDRIETTLGSTSTISDNNGTDYQIIKEITTQFINSGQIKVDVTFAMATTVVQTASAISNLEYLLAMSVADHTKSRDKSDKETPVVDIQPYFVETTDPTMIVPVNSILLHTGSNIDSDPVESSTIRPGDDFNGVTFFSLNRNDVPNFPRANAAIAITKVRAELIAKDGNDFFTLDFENQNLVGSEVRLLDGSTSVPELDSSKDRGFSSPVDDLRKFFTVKNRHDLDGGGLFVYEVNCPFVFRWNKTQKLNGVPNVFLDPTAPANEHKGKNHNWAHYFTGAYSLFYRITITATKDGVSQVYTLDSQLLVEDYLQGDEWDSENIKTFKTDATGLEGDPILNGSDYGAMENDLTLIRAEKTYIGLDADPVLGDLEAVFLVSIFEEGNFKSSFLISTLYDKTGVNPWIGLSGILTATLTDQGGGVFRLQAILQGGNFSSGEEIRIGCRYYDKRDEAPPVPPAVGILEEDGTFIIEEGLVVIFGIEE